MTTVVLAVIGVLTGVGGMVVGLRRSRPRRPAQSDEPVLRVAVVEHWLAPDLAVVGTTGEQFQRSAAVAAAGGAAVGVATVAVLAASGAAVGVFGTAGFVVTGSVVGVALAVVDVRRQAGRQRRAAVRAVGTFLDLVVMCMAGGMGVESALEAAAGIPDDKFSQQVAQRLGVARHDGRPPWAVLADLGAALGIEELAELAGAISLAGTEGARVRATLTAKAESLRRRQLAAMEAEANAMTERLFVPGAMLLMGFLVFLGYPALVRVLSGL